MIFESSLSIRLSSWWYLNDIWAADCLYDDFWIEFERPIVLIMIFESWLSVEFERHDDIRIQFEHPIVFMMIFEWSLSGRLSLWWNLNRIRLADYFHDNTRVLFKRRIWASCWYSNPVWASDCVYDDIWLEFERPNVFMMIFDSISLSIERNLNWMWAADCLYEHFWIECERPIVFMMIFESHLTGRLSLWRFLNRIWTADCLHDDIWMKFERPIVSRMKFESNLSGRLFSW